MALMRALPVFLLMSLAAGAAIAENMPGSAEERLLGDRENYASGRFGAYASPWSVDLEKKKLRQGIDYNDTIKVTPSRFPDGTVITWKWPQALPTVAGVYGYMHVYLGNYDGGNPPVKSPPTQVKTLKTFEQNISISYLQGDDDGFNVLNEFWLTETAGANDKKLYEIGFMLHTNQRTAGNATKDAEALGAYQDSHGRAWRVVRFPGNVPYIVFIPASGEDFNGSLDIKHALEHLIGRSVISGNEWINGVAVGVEPHFGGGSISLDAWDVSFSGR